MTGSGLIHTKIAAVMRDVTAISKSRTNPQQGYQFRGIDEVYNAMHEPLSKHGVFVVPSVVERWREERDSAKGGKLFYTTLRVSHKFYCEDGSFVEAVTVGEAMDSGDKSSNKAMSAAMKYALIEVFAIPTREDNDTENHSHEVKGGADAPQRAASYPPSATRPSTSAPAPSRPAPVANGDGYTAAKITGFKIVWRPTEPDGDPLAVVETDKGEFKTFDQLLQNFAKENIGVRVRVFHETRKGKKGPTQFVTQFGEVGPGE